MKLTVTLANRVVTAVGCANGQGGRHKGCEHAVNILRHSNFMKNVRVPIRWSDVVQEVETGRHIAALSGVTETCRQLADRTKKVVENREELLVFGGDHSCAMGTWSGVATALRPYGDLGLIWIDAHMDAHTPNTSPSGNLHGMPVAHLLGYGNKTLTRLGDRLPKLLPQNFCMVGIRSYEKGEEELLKNLGVRVFFMEEVRRRGIADVMQEALEIVTRNTAGFGLSIDIDGFDVMDAPAVGTPAEDGISAPGFFRAMMGLDMSKHIATEIVEFLPEFDDARKTSERLVVNLLESIYLTKFFQEDVADGFQKRMEA